MAAGGERRATKVDSGTEARAKPVRFRRASTKAWAEAVSRTFTYSPRGDGYYYHGKCPRCRHETGMEIRSEISLDVALAREAQMEVALRIDNVLPEPVYIQRLTVRCQCRVRHAKDKEGCGAYGNVLGIRFVP